MDTLIKRTVDERTYDMDFSRPGMIRSSDSIGSVESLTVTPDGLALGQPSISGKRVQFRCEGGVDGTRYLIRVVVMTAAGDKVQGEGYLLVQDPSA